MLQRIFNQGLQHKIWHLIHQQRIFNIIFHRKIIIMHNQLDIQIRTDIQQLVLHGDHILSFI